MVGAQYGMRTLKVEPQFLKMVFHLFERPVVSATYTVFYHVGRTTVSHNALSYLRKGGS